MKLGEKTEFNVREYLQKKSGERLLFNSEVRNILFRFLNLEITCKKL